MMTRETKIGLLVGLAFIIVIGIMLSDLNTSNAEKTAAPLQLAGSTLRTGLGSPVTDDVNPISVVPPNVTPHPINIAPPEQSVAVKPTAPASQNNTPNNLHELAQRNGEELVDPNQSNNTQEKAPVAPERTAVATAKTYQVQPGDSLTKIAAKAYGSGTRANVALIIAANPTLKENPNRLVVGKSYVIPALASAGAPEHSPIELAPVANKPTAQPEHIYVVEQGDTLWSIAVDELGSAQAMAAIKDLNKDVLKGGDRVRPKMKLRLPAKSVASS